MKTVTLKRTQPFDPLAKVMYVADGKIVSREKYEEIKRQAKKLDTFHTIRKRNGYHHLCQATLP